MKFKVVLYCIIFIALSLTFISASKKKMGPTPIAFKIPKGFPKPSKNIFANNTLTQEGFLLGKKLFFDTKLSKDGQVSCESCHQQFAAFSTYDHDYSHGVNNTFTDRNTPALINLAWMDKLHWDGGVNHLEVQPLNPLTAANEMAESLDSILYKLNADPKYKQMFKAAFGDEKITTQRMLKAIAQYTGSLVSANSKYDKVKRGEATFILPEQKGYELFKLYCNTCHQEPLFTDNSFRNNGITLNKYKDIGRQKITLDKKDSLKFKVPTLRNVGVTLPYMHDGRFFDVEKVIDHYRNLDTTLLNLDANLQKKITITEMQKKQLAIFLYTLTDTSFTRSKHLGF